MSISRLILRNLRKNIKNYFLYVFALVFSVALYFAFVTLQFDPALDEIKGTVKGGASIKAASILLIIIVSIFLLYANQLFVKRRSKEIGLFQLIGMTKGGIFRLLSAENFMLYFGSMVVGVFLGFSGSRLVMMILLKIMDVDVQTSLRFSPEALQRSLIVFGVIYLFILLMNYTFIKRQTILSLFRVVSSAEGKVGKVTLFQMIYGALGIVLILGGYYVSTELFSGAFSTMTTLFLAMVLILGFVISGTYLFYKGSVTFVTNLIRKKKGGYLNINEVLSLSSIMFRMKSNAFLLTVITTVSALAIGLLSLSYIAYYSAEQNAIDSVPTHFSFVTKEDAGSFTEGLKAEGIAYEEKTAEVVRIQLNMKEILTTNMKEVNFDSELIDLTAVSDKNAEGLDIAPDELFLTGKNDAIGTIMNFGNSGTVEVIGQTSSFPLRYTGLGDPFIVPYNLAGGSMPVAVVDESVFQRLKQDLVPELQEKSPFFIGIDIQDEAKISRANEIYLSLGLNEGTKNLSRLEEKLQTKQTMGMMMFICGFLGLTFLITSGCILYFKQMDESEDEKPTFTILRKLGFTQSDLLRGIQAKQLYNFGIPLVIGLLHSYFAVKSGWFFFGTELWTPMVIVMVIYTALYSIFGILSVLYCKKVIRDAL